MKKVVGRGGRQSPCSSARVGRVRRSANSAITSATAASADIAASLERIAVVTRHGPGFVIPRPPAGGARVAGPITIATGPARATVSPPGVLRAATPFLAVLAVTKFADAATT